MPTNRTETPAPAPAPAFTAPVDPKASADVKAAVLAASNLPPKPGDAKTGDAARDAAREELDGLLADQARGLGPDADREHRIWELHFLVNGEPIPNKS